MTEAFRVLIADPIHEDGRKLLELSGDLSVDVATGLDEAGLVARIPQYDALIVRSKTRVTAPVIAAGAALKVVGRAGIGVDNIDVPAATERGIVVFNTPDANATTTATVAWNVTKVKTRRNPNSCASSHCCEDRMRRKSID